jgi:CubicO group peptidase (beta-lactamase class C family)
MTNWLLRSVVAITAVLAGACTSASSGPNANVHSVTDSGATYVPAADWRTASPEAVGLDASRIETLTRNVGAGRYGSVQGVLIVRYGHLVYEQYAGWSREQAHTMQSVTKSVTSLLFGILANTAPRERVDLDRSVVRVFERYSTIANLDDRKRALTLRHLLTMRTSMDFWEQPYDGSPLYQLNRSSGDWVKFVLDRSMTGTPGTAWSYNSGAAILMGGVVREVSGVNVDEFARRELFEPLGVKGETWARSPFDGLPHCGGGLFLRPVDLARIGYLVLRHGTWGGRQVVPAPWIAESTRPDTRGSSLFFANYGSSYGYFWWLFPGQRGGTDAAIIAASGSGGQWLFVVPDLDLVVVVVATNGNGLDLLYDDVLPAVRR